jgi:hypothetical protein
MDGHPAQFEAIGSRLGFRIVEETPEKLRLIWQGARFPAFLCLGIALVLLFVSVPIFQAIRLRGFAGPAGALWYFPLMNLILFGISLYLLSQKRTIVIDKARQEVTLTRRSLYSVTTLAAHYSEIEKVKLGVDQVYSGFALAGSSAAESFPVPALRLITSGGQSVLLDRGSLRKLEAIGKRISDRLLKPIEVDAALTQRIISLSSAREPYRAGKF